MAVKVTVDLSNKLIIVNNGITSLDAEVDLYSDLKEDWVSNANGELGFEFPFRTVGGDPLPGGLEAGAFFFLRNDLGWRIRPYEGDHELIITGNLYPEDAAHPMTVPTLGDYTVSIPWERSSLTQQTAPQDADIDSIKGTVETLQIDLGPVPAGVAAAALETSINSIKGSGWTDETLKLLKSLIEQHKSLGTGFRV